MRGERFIETEIAHHSGNERVLLQPAGAQKIDGGDRKNFVSIDNLAVFVAEQDAIGVAIVRDADIRAVLLDEALDFLRMRAAALRVDVHAVRLVVRNDDLRPELAQNARRRFVSSAVGHIDRHAHFLKRHPARKARLGKFDIATEGVIDARGASDFSGGWANRINLAGENELFDFLFDLIVELVAVVPEKFDAVVFVGIMGGGKDDAGIGAERAGDVSHARRRQRPDDENIDAERSDAGDERVLEHVTREARVFTEHDFRARALGDGTGIQLRENVRRGAAELKRGLGGDWFHVGNAADAVSAENLLGLGHALIETPEERFVNRKLLSIRESFRSQLSLPPASGIEGTPECRLDFRAIFYLNRSMRAADRVTSLTRAGESVQNGAVAFATTHWSVVLTARGESPAAEEALEKLCRIYWWPLYGFVRRQGYATEEAQDLTQGFFALLLERKDLDAVRREKGRLRSYLLASLKNFLGKAHRRAMTVKRGEGGPLVPLEELLAREHADLELARMLSPDRIYQRRWALTLLEQVLARLGEEYRVAGRAPLFEQLKQMLTDEPGRPSQAEIARELSMSENAVKQAFHRLRQRYRLLLREEIAHTVGTPGDVEDELRHFIAVLQA